MFTGWPESSVGEKRALCAACTAACLRSMWPLVALAAITLPISSMTTSTTTMPEARALLAAGGYAGFGKLTALPLSTPPETGVNIGFGTRTAAAGGGGSSATLTVELLATLSGIRSALSEGAMLVLTSEPPLVGGATDLLATTPAG